MIDFEILEQFGTTNDRLKQVFTAKEGCDLAYRKKFEERMEARVQEGVAFNLRNYKIHAASDLAWDGQAITGEIVPLMQYAQGRIDFKAVSKQLKDLGPTTVKKFCDVDEKTSEIKSVNLSKFHEVWVNLVRSYITRRTATVAVSRTKQYPFLKYEPQSTSFVAKLRGDVLSQRIEMMTNQYGYRHETVQAIRDTFLYGHTVEFPVSAWDCQKQLFKKKRAEGFDTSKDAKIETEARIVREGLQFVRPHPSRTFADNAHPLPTVNTDTGCEFIGFWTVARFRDIDKNTAFWNRDCVAYSNSLPATLNANRAYFELYFPTAPVNFPTAPGEWKDPAGANDRQNNVGMYAGERGDEAVVLIEYRERVIPKDVGLGDYPYPVWLRMVVAGGTTVIFAEILPSLPAIYWGYNEDDARQVNTAFAHEIMPWQDQVSNLLTQLLVTQKTGLIKIIAANIDVMTPEMLAEFRKIVKGESYATGPTLFEYKGDMFDAVGLKAEEVLKLVEASTVQDVTTFFRSIVQLLQLAERVLNVSAQELGQSAPREITASEVMEISNTTNTMMSFVGLGVDEALAAKKRLLYEAFISLGKDKIFVPVVNRYMDETVKAAGFAVVTEAEEGEGVQTNLANRGLTLTGSKTALVYDYNFTSRDGQERAVNAKSAEVLVQLLGQMLNIPNFVQDLGKEKLYQFLNHIVRVSGAGVDLVFERQDSESATIPSEDDATNNKNAIQDVMRQIIEAVEKDRARIAQIEAALTGQPPPPPEGAAPATPGAATVVG